MHLKLPQKEPHSKTAAASGISRWFQHLVPSVADLLFVALLLGLSCGALGRILLRDGGTGWHIRNGQLMLQTHSIPRVDPFSATMGGQPWYAWEWLYDLLIAAIHNVLGLNGVVFYTAAVMAATFVLVFHLALRRGGSLPITLFVLVLSLGAVSLLNVLIRSGSAVNVASLFYLTPPTTALIAWAMFGGLALVGMGLTVFGVWLARK